MDNTNDDGKVHKCAADTGNTVVWIKNFVCWGTCYKFIR